MKEYDTGMNRTMLAAMVVAIVIAGGLLAASTFIPGGILPTTTPTTTTTTGPNGSNYGIRAANYLNSRVDNVEFYWLYNCSFVNEDLSAFYQETEPSVFVDGVKMVRGVEGVDIEVLFAPYDHNIVGTGSISLNDWGILSGSIINDGIGQMSDAVTHPDDWPHTWPVDLILEIYFDDDTFFQFGYTSSDSLVYLQNGTWTGGFTEWGWPDIVGLDGPAYWLNEGGHLTTPMNNLYTSITSNTPYP